MGVSHTPLTPSTKKFSLGKYELRTSILRLTTKETKRGEWYVVMSQLTWGDIPPEAYLFRHTSECKWYSKVPPYRVPQDEVKASESESESESDSDR